MISNQSKPDGVQFRLQFKTFHRTIRIAAIFIAVLIFASVTIPAGSDQTLREGVKLELPIPDQLIPLELPPDFEYGVPITLYVKYVTNLGLYEFAEKKQAWAIVRSRYFDGRYTSEGTGLLFLSGVRMQELFQSALVKELYMSVQGHRIAKPEGWVGTEKYPMFEATDLDIIGYTEPLGPTGISTEPF